MSGNHWFMYHNTELTAFYHMYNLTHLNERMVEIAVARHWLKTAREPLLEVGNVLGHYRKEVHDVLDLYEERSWYQRQHIINEDLLTWTPYKSYKSVVSISTIEHTADPILAIKQLKEFIAPGGSLLLTFPTGTREELDDVIYDAFEHFDLCCTIAREDNDHGGWGLTQFPEVRPYGPWANCVAICEWTAP